VASGDVVVIVNSTAKEVAFAITTPDGRRQQYHLAAGSQVSVPTRGRPKIALTDREQAAYPLDANAAYYFEETDAKGLDLRKIDLGGNEYTWAGRDLLSSEPLDKVHVIRVKLAIDDDRPANQEVWDARLKKRVKAASDIFEECCRIRFEVVAVDTWDSDDQTTDFAETALEFGREVDPGPARLVIGFTGQYPVLPGKKMCLGLTQGPLGTHVLLRERWRITEPERLEILLHELGHFLGAVHTPSASSAMRPILADGRARAANFRIGFDPVSALAMYLVAEEIRFRKVVKLSQLSRATRLRLRQIYGVLVKLMPEDPANRKYLALVDPAGTQPVLAATRQVVQAVVEAARSNAALPAGARLAGDALTDNYVRHAARVAAQLPDEVAPQAFLYGLAIAMDDSDSLLKTPLTGEFCLAIEPLEERRERLDVLGQPTMRGRRDLAQHFVVSVYLTAAHGSVAAEAAGLAKELLDAKKGSGFSFADLAADKAGVMFASQVLTGKIRCADLSRAFSVSNYLPSVDQLPEGIGWDEFVADYSEESGEKYQRTTQDIIRRIRALPPYAP